MYFKHWVYAAIIGLAIIGFAAVIITNQPVAVPPGTQIIPNSNSPLR